VIVGHLYNGIPHANLANPLWKIVTNAELGVSIFFVISGFLITSILISEWESTGTIKISEFYRRRMFRILPASYFYVGIVAILGFMGVLSVSKVDLISAGLYVWNYSPWAKCWALEHLWSLSLEEQFYLFWPALLLRMLASGGRELAIKVATGLVIVAPFLRAATFAAPSPFLKTHLFYMLHTRIDVLMAGCLAALCWNHQAVQKRIEEAPLWVISAMAGFVVLLSPLLTNAYGGKYIFLIGFSTESVFITIVMMWVVKHYDSFAGRLLNSRILIHVGFISYSLYLWQTFFLHEANKSLLGKVPLSLVCILLCAEFSYFFVEKPFLRIRDQGKSLAAHAS
jgi:peptidoglycan/LPS O-acetylase OafA/YrhL